MTTIVEKYLKIKNGYSLMAIVQIGFEENGLGENRIYNEVEVIPFRSQGYIEGGHAEWTKAATLAIEWGIKKANLESHFDVYIYKLEGRQFLETNPTIIGTTVIKAVWKYLNFVPSKCLSNELERLNIESREVDNQLIVPNFDEEIAIE